MMEIKVNNKILRLKKGDITKEEVDAIVNAANKRLAGGGGVDGAIHRAGGPEIMEECRKIGGCPTGKAVITTAGKLKAKAVIHTVGPIYSGKPEDPVLLSSCYKESLLLAQKHGFKTISFPSISTGVYGYPEKEAAEVALNTVIKFLKGSTCIEEVNFVLFTDSTYSNYKQVLEKLIK